MIHEKTYNDSKSILMSFGLFCTKNVQNGDSNWLRYNFAQKVFQA